MEEYEDDEIYLGDLKKKGEEYLKNNSEKFLEIINSAGPDDIVNICYTSGTTADPKGIILTHRNYTFNIEQTLTLMDVPDWWTTLLVLPWDHSFAQTVGINIMMAVGASIHPPVHLKFLTTGNIYSFAIDPQYINTGIFQYGAF